MATKKSWLLLLCCCYTAAVLAAAAEHPTNPPAAGDATPKPNRQATSTTTEPTLQAAPKSAEQSGSSKQVAEAPALTSSNLEGYYPRYHSYKPYRGYGYPRNVCIKKSITCTAPNTCQTLGTCNPATGSCVGQGAPTNENGTCPFSAGVTGVCKSGVCSKPATDLCAQPGGTTCTAPNTCQAAGICNSATGSCVGQGAPVRENGTCPFSSSITGACKSGVCTDLCAQPGGTTCTAPNTCQAAGVCNPATGSCVGQGTPTNENGTCTLLGGSTGVCGNGVCTDPTCQSPVTLDTVTNVDNLQNGIMFEIRNARATSIRVDSFDQVFNSFGSDTVQIYTLSGPCDGQMANATAWTLVGSADNVVHGAFPILAPLPIPIGTIIQPGAVQSYYITITDPFNYVAYLNGNSQYGQVYASNSDIELVARGGVAFAFGGVNGADLFGLPFTPGETGAGRLWQGAVN